MSRSMPRRGLDDHLAVAEYIVFVFIQDDGLAVFEIFKEILLDDPRGFFGEHGVALFLSHQPSRTCKCVRIRRVIGMVMRKRHILNVRGRVANRCKLREQGLGHSRSTLRHWSSVSLKSSVWNHTDVPHERSLRIDDQVARDDNACLLDVRFLHIKQVHAEALNGPAIKHIKPDLTGFRPASLLTAGCACAGVKPSDKTPIRTNVLASMEEEYHCVQ